MSVVVAAITLTFGKVIRQNDDESLEDDQEEILLFTLCCFQTVLHPLYHLLGGHFFWIIGNVKAISCLDLQITQTG